MILDDDLNLGESPPRPLSISTHIKYLLQGCMVQGAFLVGIIASVLFWIFGIKFENLKLYFVRNTWIETIGTFNQVEFVNTDFGKNFYQYKFTYEVNGQILEGASTMNELLDWTEGSKIPIIYNPTNFFDVMIIEFRTEIFDFLQSSIYVILPMLLALFLLLRGLWQNLKLILLLKYGSFTKAKVSVKDLSKSPYKRYYYNFEINGTKYKSDFINTKNEEVDFKQILYLPNSPKNHLPLLELVNTKKMDKFGKILEPNYSVFMTFFLPFIIVAVNIIGCFLN